MTIEATPAGVEIKPTPNPRDQAMREIAAAHNERVKENFVDVVPDAPTLQDVTPEAATEPQDVTETTEATEVSPEVKEEPAERLVTLKVDGKEVQVPEARILEAGRRALQKQESADRRLEEATRLLREAQARTQKETPQPSIPDAAAVTERLLGTKDDVQEAVKMLMERPQAATPDISNFVRQEMEAQRAVDSFRTEFADIAKDPYLYQMAVQLENERLQRLADGLEDPEPLIDAFKKHGTAIRKWRDSIAKPAVNIEKLERKAAVTNIPAANVKQAAPSQQKALTPSEIITQMRKARGQAI